MIKENERRTRQKYVSQVRMMKPLLSCKKSNIGRTIINVERSRNSLADQHDPLLASGNEVRPGRIDPGFPALGSRMTVVCHGLPQIIT